MIKSWFQTLVHLFVVLAHIVWQKEFFFIFVFINGQFSSIESHHKLTREPLTDERLRFDLWDFSLLWRRWLGLPVFHLAQPELKKSASPYTSLRELKRMRVMSGGTEEKEITCGSNSDPRPPHPHPPNTRAPDSRCILSGVVPSVPRNKCSFCVYMLS